jgi:hypothetical protein
MKGLCWMNFALGLWLIVAAFALTRVEPAMSEEAVLGVVIVGLSLWSAFSRPSAAISWSIAGAGLWTLIAPAILNYGIPQRARVNDIVVGLMVIPVAIVNALYRQSMTGAERRA